MDWTRARAVLLVAFAVVNLVLAYSLWGPKNSPSTFAEPSARSQVINLQARLADRGLELPSGVVIPQTPGPMAFLRVEYQPDPAKTGGAFEQFQGALPQASNGTEAPAGFPGQSQDQETRAVVYDLKGFPGAVREIDLTNRTQVRLIAEEFLRIHHLFQPDAQLSGLFPWEEGGLMVEFVPRYQTLPVYSGYVRVYLSEWGIERVVFHWVRPIGFKEGPTKAVRPAAEALLRLAGHLEQQGEQIRTILDVRLGYYSGPSVTVPLADEFATWETVPVWRISLDNGLVYYINAFNGELES